MTIDGVILSGINRMLTPQAKSALVMVYTASDKYNIVVPENDLMVSDFEPLVALHLLTDEPGSILPGTRKFWLTRLGYEFTKGYMSIYGAK